MAVNKDNVSEVRVEVKDMNPQTYTNQLWRFENASDEIFDNSTIKGNQQIVCKLYGRTLRREEGGETLMDWQISNRIEGEQGFIAIEEQACSMAWLVTSDVVFFPQDHVSACDEWEIEKVEEDGDEITPTLPITAITTTTTEPAPTNIEEFLAKHNLQHLHAKFAQHPSITLDFLPELTREDIRDLGIDNFVDVSRLQRAIKSIRSK